MRTVLLCVAAGLVFIAGCTIDPGPVQTGTSAVELGNADTVRAEIRMSAGELWAEGGASRLLDATFRYSERVGRPAVHYNVTGGRGLLTIESPESDGLKGNATNEWRLRMDSAVPLDLSLRLGAGESHLDLSQIRLRAAEVNIGAGNMTFTMADRYTQDVDVQIHGGVGEAHIRLPRESGVVVDATGGIGSIQAGSLTKRDDGKYYNSAYADDQPAVHMRVRGGIGDIVFE
jgi:hypothetical protein